jgi:hypothetical protein
LLVIYKHSFVCLFVCLKQCRPFLNSTYIAVCILDSTNAINSYIRCKITSIHRDELLETTTGQQQHDCQFRKARIHKLSKNPGATSKSWEPENRQEINVPYCQPQKMLLATVQYLVATAKWLTSRPGRFNPREGTRYPGCIRYRSGWVRKISPHTEIRTRNHPVRSESLYRRHYLDVISKNRQIYTCDKPTGWKHERPQRIWTHGQCSPHTPVSIRPFEHVPSE